MRALGARVILIYHGGKVDVLRRAPAQLTRALALGLLVATAFAGCKEAVPAPPEQTEIFVTVRSTTTLDEIVLRVINRAGYEDTISQSVRGRNLSRDPFTLLLRPTTPASGSGGISEEGEFLLHGKGLRDGERVAGGSLQLAFSKGRRTEATLHVDGDFIDADDDGFPDCDIAGRCDCIDGNRNINPYAEEQCNDGIDSDCSGWPVDVDPKCSSCTADAPALPCTKMPPSRFHLAGIGACYLGELRCVDGVRETVCDSGEATADLSELPDNFVDDNCNGVVDEGSECSAGSTRRCHRGFVDDASHPDPQKRSAASDLAMGTCANPVTGLALGVQSCGSDGRWQNACQGDVPPVRIAGGVGWVESTCDGLDENCDGTADDKRDFDADGDGYTFCGTAPSGGVADEYVDCNDTSDTINPGVDEICGNAVDEDCRCDHGSSVGAPTVRANGTSSCTSPRDYLDCGAGVPRSDPTVPGTCSDGNGALYYWGFAPIAAGGEIACYSCSDAYGTTCVPETDAENNVIGGHCQTREEGCAGCTAMGDAIELRPLCFEQVAGSCRGLQGPDWVPLSGDPFEECGAVSCAGVYFGRAGPGNAQCYEVLDVPASETFCLGSLGCDGVTPELCCDQKSDVCSTARGPEAAPLPLAVCTKVTGGCVGTTAPVIQNQVPGEDLFSECNQSFVCNTTAGGGPFYDGIRGSPPQCHFKDDVVSNACNGAGACQSNAEACLAMASGTRFAPRPTCKMPSAGCSGASAPVFGTSVPMFTDPYNECPPGLGCCQNGCCKDLGQTCSGANDCRSGLSCVDGVCCGSACDGACQACAQALTGQADGSCAPLASSAVDLVPSLVCGGTTGGCAGGNCICEAGSGACKTANGAVCANNAECASGQCECTDASCTQKRCSPTDCDCGFNVTGDASCDGMVNDGVDDGDNSCLAQSCNGAGACNVANNATCTSHQACESNHCECTTAACTSRSCSAAACACRYNGNGDTSCDGLVTTGQDDPQDCAGASSCYAGACLADVGQPCGGDAACGAGHCECQNAGCTTRACAAADCDCRYDATGGCTTPLSNGIDDPEDCIASGQSCYAGSCLFDNNESCTADAQCGSGNCECADPSCSSRHCAQGACVCGFDVDGNSASCDGNLADTTDDPEDCFADGSSCYGGACKKDNTQGCTADAECGSGNCECVSAACGVRQCAPSACACGFDTTSDGACDGNLTGGVDDPEDCQSTTQSCYGGACKKDNTQPCAGDVECGLGNCECTSSGCTARQCNAVACVCGFDTTANGACDGSLTAGVDDPEDCQSTTQSCYGGSCLRDINQLCTSDGQCGSGNCECTDSSCSTRRCGQVACVCGFNTDGNTAVCDGSLTDTVDDPEDCSVTGVSCYGGACKKDNAQSCAADAECGGGNCECVNSGCTQRQCAATACACGFDADSDGACDGELAAGVNDPEDCVAAGFACYGGACKKNNGQGCGGDSECGSSSCECLNAACTGRACNAAACFCGFDTEANGACDGTITAGLDDPEDCFVGGSSCYGGACKKDNGQVCAADSECGSANCECTSAGCAVRQCSAVACSCGYNSDGTTASCDGNLTSGTDDPEDCQSSTQSCYGGSCLRDLQQTCSQDTQCGSGNCECADNLCTVSRCSLTACVCGFNADGTTGTCDGSLTDTTDDPEDCATLGSSCYGGSCKKDNTHVCVTDGDCGSGNCECTDGSCTARACAAAPCFCRFDSGSDGICDGSLANTIDDPDDCIVSGSSCYGGNCRKDNAQSCTGDIECGLGNCECTSASCAARQCNAVACYCGYDAEANGACNGNLNATADDPEDCQSATSSCYGGSCLLDNGQLCTADAQCGTGNCECTGNACAQRRCAPAACACGFDAASDGTCDGFLTGGVDDPEDCQSGTSSCYGGACKKDNGQSCTGDVECGIGNCECTGANCTSRVCNNVACVCGYDATSNGACDGNLTNLVDDPEDCESATSSCYGGACKKDNGQSCTGDVECGIGNCECTGPSCSARACNAVACRCRYDAAADGACDAELAPGADDPEHCESLTQSCYGGACLLDNNEVCTGNAQCGSQNCECVNNTCTQRRCAPTSCPCRFDAAVDGVCDGFLVSGSDDPEFCESSTQSCYGGNCRKDNGQSCAGDGECGESNCECVNASCSARQCNAVACYCGYDTTSTGVCDGSLTPGSDDPEDCQSSTSSCYGTSCLLDNNEVCTTDTQCGSGNCECADATCTVRRCNAVACYCGYDNTSNGACDGNLSAGNDDPEDCDTTGNSCYAGNCRKDDGQVCTGDGECGFGNCECTGASCSTRQCNAVACLCGYDALSDGACDGNLTNLVKDPEDCFAAGFACFGGVCKKENGQTCTADLDCGESHCECTSATCAARQCNAVACLCRYDATSNGACDGNLNATVDDPEDCQSATSSCYGGTCLLDDNQGCVADAQCGRGNCECIDATCSTRRCNAVPCSCRFDATSNGACDGNLNATVDDPEDCESATSSCYGASCLLDDGQSCSGDAECGSGNCECADASCSARRCSAVACACGYNGATDGTCDGLLGSGVDDPEDCQSATSSCYAGACLKDDGQSCAGNGECGHGQCECQNATCSAKVCSSADCGICTFTANGTDGCTGFIAAYSDDADLSCIGGESCDGSGACLSDDNVTCALDGECISDICECASSTDCSIRECSPVACPCGYNADGNGSCDGTFPAFTDRDNECGNYFCVGGALACDTTCESSVDAQCKAGAYCQENGANDQCVTDEANGQSCTLDGDCASGNCECTDAACTVRLCRAQACFCDFDSAGTGCDGQLADGVDDPGDCAGTSSCYNGTCLADNGQSCTADGQCGSGNCECQNNTCSAKVCSDTACPSCTFTSDGLGACGGNLNVGVDDASDSCGAGSSCNGAGGCGLDNGQSCTSDGQCGSGQCECQNASCSSFICSRVNCPCQVTNGTSCTGNVNNGAPASAAPGGYCPGYYACYNGACATNCELLGDGQCILAGHCQVQGGPTNDQCVTD